MSGVSFTTARWQLTVQNRQHGWGLFLVRSVTSRLLVCRFTPIVRVPFIDVGFQRIVDEILEGHLVDFELVLGIGASCVCHLRDGRDAENGWDGMVSCCDTGYLAFDAF